jgi:hypothetical protein
MSPPMGADWATSPAPGLIFDDVVVFQPVSAVCDNDVNSCKFLFYPLKWCYSYESSLTYQITIYRVFLSMGNKAQFFLDTGIQIMK